jgi:hypothetical protein
MFNQGMVPAVRYFPLLLTLAACGAGSNDGMPNAKTALADPGPAYAPTPAVQPHVIKELHRADINSALQIGLGYFLQNVDVDTDQPVMVDGKFHGWALRAYNPEWILDLKPGDVITRVNGIVPEQPDDADNAFRSLAKAKTLKIDFERRGERRTLELPIID